VNFKRYNNDGRKLNNHIKIAHNQEIFSSKFKLHSSIDHVGDTVDSGHYFYKLYDVKNTTIFDDDIVMKQPETKRNISSSTIVLACFISED